MPQPTIELAVGTVPANLVLPPGTLPVPVNSDMYRICDRIREIDESLYIVLLEGQKYPYAIMENCKDGTSRLVFKVYELDARVLDKLRRLMSMPLHYRIKKLEQENHRFEQQEHEQEMERLYEEIGRPMWTMLEKCGFIDGRGVSFPKAGVATRGKKRK